MSNIRIIGKEIRLCDDDRIIGVSNDNKTETKTFILNRIYGDIDLSTYQAWLSVEPVDKTKTGYNQLLKKTVDGDNIILSWIIDKNNTESEGKLFVVIKFAKNVGSETLIWQSFREYFLVRRSINANKEAETIGQNIFEAAVANALSYATAAATAKTEALSSKTAAAASAAAAQAHAATASAAASSATESAASALVSKNNAADSAAMASNYVLNGVSVHNNSESAHPSILQAIQTAESIARGKSLARVFDTYNDMTAWLTVAENTEALNIGDNLYIRDLGVKDYWWDGTEPQVLEAEAPDLTDYYTKEQVNALLPISISRSAYVALETAGTIEAGRTYDIWED